MRGGEPFSLVIVTGPSGAGRSTAIRAFEDLGYEVIDNLPLSLIPRLLEGGRPDRPLALGVDVRNRDFSTDAFLALVDELARQDRMAVNMLYIDCAVDKLIRRYSETRRRHPLAVDEALVLGIEREMALLAPIRARAEHLIDTSDLSLHELKAEIFNVFQDDTSFGLAVLVQSFSYKRGLPRGADMVFDCRFLKNPHWVPLLRPLDGRDKAVEEYVSSDERFTDFLKKLYDMITFLLPAYRGEGKAYVTVAFGCTGGQHRSVLVAEQMADRLSQAGWSVSKRHRELEHRLVQPPER